jgi:Ca-activated chloride channel homolog
VIAYWNDIHFASPAALYLLLLLPLLALWYRWRYSKLFVPLALSALPSLKGSPVSWRIRALSLLPVLRLLALSALVLALARPQSSFSQERITTEGIDIVLAMDVSTSMWAVDFKPNRIEAAKKTAAEFIEGRPQDRMGLVVFAGEAFTQCPITLDHRLLLDLVRKADAWQIQDGTALGDGLWLALGRLMDSTALQSRVVILLTDGVQTAGEFAPLDAARAASDLGIRVYTIGIGSQTSSNIPVLDKNGRKIFELDPRTSMDEPALQQIAEMTGGRYFRATSADKLREIYTEIDQLERQKIEVNVSQRYEEKFYPLAWLAGILLLLEMLLRLTVLRTAT